MIKSFASTSVTVSSQPHLLLDFDVRSFERERERLGIAETESDSVKTRSLFVQIALT